MKLLTILFLVAIYLGGIESAALNPEGYNYEKPELGFEQQVPYNPIEGVADRLAVAEEAGLNEAAVDNTIDAEAAHQEAAADDIDLRYQAVAEEVTSGHEGSDLSNQYAVEAEGNEEGAVAAPVVEETVESQDNEPVGEVPSIDETQYAVVAEAHEEGAVMAPEVEEVAVESHDNEPVDVVASIDETQYAVEAEAHEEGAVVAPVVEEVAVESHDNEPVVEAQTQQYFTAELQGTEYETQQEEVNGESANIQAETQQEIGDVAIAVEVRGAEEEASQQQNTIEPISVDSLTAVGFEDKITEENLSAQQHNFEGYNYDKPLPGQLDIEAAFVHQDLGSEHKSHRQGPVRRLKLKGPPLSLKSAVSCGDNARSWLQVVVDRSQARPKNRRLIPYTEEIADQSYFEG